MDLFNPNFDWTKLVGERGSSLEPYVNEICGVLTRFGRHGIQRPDGQLIQQKEYQRMQQARETAIMQAGMNIARETGGGFITPDMYPNFFTPDTATILPHDFPEPDTSYLDWVVQRKMLRQLEDRKEWGFTIKFVRMRRAGQIEYGKFADTTAQMTSEEWGAGIEIFRTWFEENVFGIKMSTLAPEVRAAYYDEIADTIYTGVTSATWGGSYTPTNILVTDINNSMYERARYIQTWNDKKIFKNMKWRILAPPEMEKYINAMMAMNYAAMQVTEQLSRRIAVTYTDELPFTAASAKIYLVADKWKKNELGTRIPFGVFGSSTDIDTFCDKIAYRGDWGFQLDPESGTELTFDLTSGFMIAPPMPIIDMTPTPSP